MTSPVVSPTPPLVSLLTLLVLLPLQLTVQASDQALPSDRTTTVQVVVTVPRDTQPPTFERQLYNVEIPEAQPVGSTIAEIKANDANKQVSDWKSFQISYS